MKGVSRGDPLIAEAAPGAPEPAESDPQDAEGLRARADSDAEKVRADTWGARSAG